jgi:hypothetical protein
MGMTQVTSDLIVYKISASHCDLHIGDLVKPGTPIGEHYDTDELLKSEVYGQVEGIHFSGADHALVILIRTEIKA